MFELKCMTIPVAERGVRRFAVTGRGSGKLAAPADAFVCRLSPEPAFERIPGEPSPFDEAPGVLLQTGIGDVSTRCCNGLYAPESDAALLLRADELEITPIANGAFSLSWNGPLTFREIPDYMRDFRHLGYYAKLDRSRFPRPIAGWCSWYSYYQNVNSAAVRRNVDFLEKTLRDYGLEWIQLDDGWHGNGFGHASNRDFFAVCKAKFPEGLRALSDYIRAHGFRPGLWCMPFSQSVQEHEVPKHVRASTLYVRTPEGESISRFLHVPDNEPDLDKKYDWFGMYVIDPTGEAGKHYLETLTRLLADEYGFDFLKLDGQGRLVNWYARFRRQLANPGLTGAEAYRQGLGVMRSVLGEDRLMLNCAQSYVSCGLCELIRTGPDVKANWSGVKIAAESTYLRQYLNTIAFYTDPDVVCVRDPLQLEEARIWVTLVGLTGQVVLLSDFMPELPPERLELVKKILPVADIHPMDLFPMSSPESGSVINCRINRPAVGAWNVAAVINFSGTDTLNKTLSAELLGLDPMKEYVVMDYWRGKLAAAGSFKLPLELGCHTSKLFGVWEKTGWPQFVGSSRHLTMGATDVLACHWDGGSESIALSVLLTRDDEARFYFYVPENWEVEAPLERDGEIAFLKVTSDRNSQRKWELRFTPCGGTTLHRNIVAASSGTPPRGRRKTKERKR